MAFFSPRFFAAVIFAACPCGALAASALYDANPPPRPRLLIDYYHHEKASTRIGNYIISGSWSDNVGRYGLNDFVHTNSFDPVLIGLEKDFAIQLLDDAPYSEAVLANTDVAFLLNPDNPRLNPKAVILTDGEIAALQRFVRNGGSLLVMTNSGGRGDEDFEGVQLRKLLHGFGLDCNQDDTHYSDNVVGDGHPYFYDVPIFHYGAGCTLQILPKAEQPTVLMENYSDAGYPERHVRGPGMVLVRPGKGKVLLVGDTGSWTGNMSRPWAENERVLKQLFRYLKRDQGVVPARWTAGTSLTYEMTASELDMVPVRNSLSELPRPLHRAFSPRPITNIPFLEASAQIEVRCREVSAQHAAKLDARIRDFRWFDRAADAPLEQHVQLLASRQGKVSGLEASEDHARWLAPDLSVLVALLPVDGLRPGDRWESVEPLRVPTVLGADLPAVKPVTIEIVYARDETIGEKACRVLRAEGEVWLSEIGVRAEDILPVTEARRAGGSRYEFFHPRGGKLMFRREQWVEAATGVVVKARTQCRSLLWLHDIRRPVPANNADKDNEMIVSLAHVVNFALVPATASSAGTGR